jgi:hypothetical protein
MEVHTQYDNYIIAHMFYSTRGLDTIVKILRFLIFW